MAGLVFITGASSGLGRALAWRYATQGWHLALVARRGEAIRQAMDSHHIDAQQYRAFTALT